MTRESLAHALSGPISLQEDEYRERPVDRLHALASSQGGTKPGEIEAGGKTYKWMAQRTQREAHLAALGKSWIALRDAVRVDELKAVRDGLIVCLMWSKPKPTVKAADKTARWVIIERVHENCPTCKGKREIPDTEKLAGRVVTDGDGHIPMKECPQCNGTGKHRYSNRERIEGLEIEAGELHKYSRLLSDAEMWLSQAESQMLRSTAQLLERWR